MSTTDECTLTQVGHRDLSGLMSATGPIYIDPCDVKALECNADRTVSILMDDHRVYVSTDDIGIVLLSLGGKRPERAVTLILA